MFKKIEIWILYLVIIIFVIVTFFFGALVRQELVGSTKFGNLSKFALIISEIPVNIKRIYNLSKDPGDAMRAQDDHINKAKLKNYFSMNRDELLILSRFDGSTSKSLVEIIDLKDFKVIHKYDPNIAQIIKKAEENNEDEFFRIKINSNEKRFIFYHPYVDSYGNLITHAEDGPIFKLDICSNIDWVQSDERYHHSVEKDHEGNFWIPAYLEPYSDTMKKYRKRTGLLDDAITKISDEGKTLYKKSIFDILIEGKVIKYNHVYIDNDPFHLNDIQPVLKDGDYWKQGDLFLSLRNINTIVLYRPSENKVLKVITGPFYMQHDVDIISDNEISIFNNNYLFTKNGPKNENVEILIYNFTNDTFSKSFKNSIEEISIKTSAGGLSDFLNDGSILIEEQQKGRLLLIDKNEELEWEYVNKTDDDKIYQLNWSRIINNIEHVKKLRNEINNKNCK